MSIFGQKTVNPDKKMPSVDQWAQFLKILSKKERWIFLVSFLLFIFSAGFLLISIYHKNTNVIPSDSGSFKYGMVGQPQTINPLYAYSSDIDRTLTELTFSSLMDYDQNGDLVPDLIKDYHLTDSGRTIEFSLKENAEWSDGKPLTVDDVIFTIHLVQDSDFMSPLRANWQGVEIEKTSDYKGLIKFKQAYSGALELLANLKIMPKHIWQNATFQGMAGNSELNLFAPIGSGPYKVSKVDQRSNKTVKSITLVSNRNYYNQPAHIQKIQIVFFDNQTELYNSIKKGAIDVASIDNSPSYDLSKDGSLNQYLLNTPDYFSLFFNNNSGALKDKAVRTALSEAINKDEIVNAALLGRGESISSPLLPQFYGTFSEPANPITFNLDTAAQALDKAGYALVDDVRQKTLQKTTGFKFTQVMQSGSSGSEVKKLQECLAQDPAIYPSQNISGNFGDETKKAVIAFQEKYKDEILTPNGLTAGTGKVSAATIKKLNEVCFVTPVQTTLMSFTIKTSDSPALVIAANAIKNQLQKSGVQITVQPVDSIEMKRVLRERDFDLLLFGEKLGMIPDPLPYWHSSQVIDPGFNFALYQNTSLDTLLEKQRTYSDANNADRLKTLESIQTTLVADSPAVYLYSPKNVLMASKKIKGIALTRIADPSRIFSTIESWYIGEKRVWK
jgi:peptide/nickel transport system substrate-binding protein